MASFAMLVGGALVNALAFTGSNYLFSMLRSSGVDEERKRHDKAVEQLQAAQATWSRKRTERLDWLNEELRQQGHAVKTFRDVDAAMQEYAQVTGHNLDPLGPEPQLADFYHPSGGQRDRLCHPVDGRKPAWWPTDSTSNAGCRRPCFLRKQKAGRTVSTPGHSNIAPGRNRSRRETDGPELQGGVLGANHEDRRPSRGAGCGSASPARQ